MAYASLEENLEPNFPQSGLFSEQNEQTVSFDVSDFLT